MAGYRLTQTGAEVQALLDKISVSNITDNIITIGEDSLAPIVIETDPTVPAWAKTLTKPSYALSELSDDSSHRTVTDIEKSTWNSKQDAINDLDDIRSGAAAGAVAYQKPVTGIPKSDLASAVQTSLNRADTALQSFTETDPTVPSWAKQTDKPSYTYTEISGTPIAFTDIELQNYIDDAFAIV